MTKYESTVKQIYAPVDNVFARLSDLSTLEALRSLASNPQLAEQVRARTGRELKPEELDRLRATVERMEFSADAISMPGTPAGDIGLRIVERDAPKCVKLALEGAPVMAHLWIQLQASNGGTLLKCTLGAELNFFMKQLIGGKAREGVEQLAQMLTMLPY